VRNDAGSDLARRIDDIESSYEFLLAYAAQGRQHDQGTEARARLTTMVAALDGFATQARAALQSDVADRESEIAPYLDAVERDAAVARGAVALVLRRESIPSLLVDNLNASVHLRALLTDLFLIEQFLKP
jgi:hypothetical protein